MEPVLPPVAEGKEKNVIWLKKMKLARNVNQTQGLLLE
jgi:hypothetical protein